MYTTQWHFLLRSPLINETNKVNL